MCVLEMRNCEDKFYKFKKNTSKLSELMCIVNRIYTVKRCCWEEINTQKMKTFFSFNFTLASIPHMSF